MVKVKNGVVFKVFPLRIIDLLLALEIMSDVLNKDIWITCAWRERGNEINNKGSYHPDHLAIDIRISNLTMAETGIIVDNLIQYTDGEFRPFYDIVLESDHIHIEFDERRYLKSRGNRE